MKFRIQIKKLGLGISVFHEGDLIEISVRWSNFFKLPFDLSGKYHWFMLYLNGHRFYL